MDDYTDFEMIEKFLYVTYTKMKPEMRDSLFQITVLISELKNAENELSKKRTELIKDFPEEIQKIILDGYDLKVKRMKG